MILNFRHIGIVVEDLNKSLHFYNDLLGFELIKRMNESGEYINNLTSVLDLNITTVKLRIPGGGIVELIQINSPNKRHITASITNVGITHFALTVDNIDETYRYLSEHGVKFVFPPIESPDGYAKVSFCKDPNNIFIELVQEI